MELLNNFSEIFLSVWNRGILGVDIFQILIGIGIFLIFLIFRGFILAIIVLLFGNIIHYTAYVRFKKIMNSKPNPHIAHIKKSSLLINT